MYKEQGQRCLSCVVFGHAEVGGSGFQFSIRVCTRAHALAASMSMPVSTVLALLVGGLNYTVQIRRSNFKLLVFTCEVDDLVVLVETRASSN